MQKKGAAVLEPEGLAGILGHLQDAVHVAHVHGGHVIWTAGGKALIPVDIWMTAHFVHLLHDIHNVTIGAKVLPQAQDTNW